MNSAAAPTEHIQIQRAVGPPNRQIEGVAGFDFIDDERIDVTQGGHDDAVEFFRRFRHQIHRGVVTFFLHQTQHPGRLRAVFGIVLVKPIQQQQIAQIEDLGGERHIFDIFHGKLGIGAPAMEERPLALAGHHFGKAAVGAGSGLQKIHIDPPFFRFGTQIFAVVIVADTAGGVQRDLRTDRRQIEQHVGRAAAGGVFHAQDIAQIPLARPAVDLHDPIDDPVTGTDDTPFFRHLVSPDFLMGAATRAAPLFENVFLDLTRLSVLQAPPPDILAKRLRNSRGVIPRLFLNCRLKFDKLAKPAK